MELKSWSHSLSTRMCCLLVIHSVPKSSIALTCPNPFTWKGFKSKLFQHRNSQNVAIQRDTTFIQFIPLYNESDYPFPTAMSGYILSLKSLRAWLVFHKNNIITINPAKRFTASVSAQVSQTFFTNHVGKSIISFLVPHGEW